MPDSAARRRAQHSVVAGDVPCNAAYHSTLDATLRLSTVRSYEEHDAQQRRSERLCFCYTVPQHTITPYFGPKLGIVAGSPFRFAPASLRYTTTLPSGQIDLFRWSGLVLRRDERPFDQKPEIIFPEVSGSPLEIRQWKHDPSRLARFV
jgi:hypothetical protein